MNGITYRDWSVYAQATWGTNGFTFCERTDGADPTCMEHSKAGKIPHWARWKFVRVMDMLPDNTRTMWYLAHLSETGLIDRGALPNHWNGFSNKSGHDFSPEYADVRKREDVVFTRRNRR